MKKDKIRERIIKIAQHIYSKFGYEKATMDKIAKSVNMGKSSVYYYFKNKEEIFREVVIREGKKFRRNIIKATDKSEDPREKVKLYILTRMNTLPKFSNFYNALINSNLAHFKFIKKINEIYKKEEIRLFRNILQQGIEKKYFKILDIELAATAIINAVKSLESLLFKLKKDSNFNKALSDVVNVIFYGIINQRNEITVKN